jgi:hypothetical protein
VIDNIYIVIRRCQIENKLEDQEIRDVMRSPFRAKHINDSIIYGGFGNMMSSTSL